MNQSKVPIDNAQWMRIALRRFAVLAFLLTINLSLVGLGINSQQNRASIAAAAAPAIDSQRQANSTESAPRAGEQQVTATPKHLWSPSQIDAVGATTSAEPIGDDPKPLVVEQRAKPTDATLSEAPVATARLAAEKVNMNEQSNSDSSSPAQIADYSRDDLDQSSADEASPSLTIINPSSSRGTVHYLISGDVHSLAPGEYHRLEGSAARQIQFHQGDERGDTERVLSTGFFVFIVGDQGWELIQKPNDVGRRLLRKCRLIDTEK